MGPSKKCRFAEVCRFYSAVNFPCNAEEEAEDYCGTFNLFANFKAGRQTQLLEQRNEL